MAASDTDIDSAGIVRALNVDNGNVRFVMEIAGSQATAYEAVKAAIEERLKLRNPIYFETAAYGHMGKEPKTVKKVFELFEKCIHIGS